MKKGIVIGFVVLLIAVVAVLGLVSAKRPKEPKLVGFKSEQGVSFSYRADLAVRALSDQDKKDKYLFRAAQPSDQPPLLITLRYEKGIKAVADISKTEPLELLVSNTRLAYPKRFPGYREIRQRRYEINNHQAAEFVFSYQNKGEALKQQFLIVMKDDNTAYYLALQVKEGDYDKLFPAYFEPITNSLIIN